MDFEALLNDESDGLTRRLAKVVGGDWSAAEDLRQEAFLRAWLSMPREAAPFAQRAWIRRAATNLAIDELRRRSRRGEVALDAAPELSGEGTRDPDGASEALGALLPHDRFLLLMRFEAGFTHRDIARLLDISEEAARKRTARARRSFIDVYRAARRHGRPVIMLVSREAAPEPYLRWLERAGAQTRLHQGRPTERELALCDGLVLTGGFDDVHSGLYGERPRVVRGSPDLDQDRLDLALTRAALALDVPLLGICRGHQLLNIACGGSLYQDVVLDGSTRESHDDGLHGLHARPDTRARRVLGKTVAVRSEHHQAVRRLGRKLTVTGTSPDGLVEAVEHAERRFALGVQWHPELDEDPGGLRIAEALIEAALGRAA